MKPTRDDLFVWVKGENEYHEKRATDAELAAMGYYRLDGIDVEALRRVVDDWQISVLRDLARQVLAALDDRRTV